MALEAALCLMDYLDKPGVKEMIVGDLELVLTRCLTLLSDIDHDGLMQAMTKLVNKFQYEISPSAA